MIKYICTFASCLEHGTIGRNSHNVPHSLYSLSSTTKYILAASSPYHPPGVTTRSRWRQVAACLTLDAIFKIGTLRVETWQLETSHWRCSVVKPLVVWMPHNHPLIVSHFEYTLSTCRFACLRSLSSETAGQKHVHIPVAHFVVLDSMEKYWQRSQVMVGRWCRFSVLNIQSDNPEIIEPADKFLRFVGHVLSSYVTSSYVPDGSCILCCLASGSVAANVADFRWVWLV